MGLADEVVHKRVRLSVRITFDSNDHEDAVYVGAFDSAQIMIIAGDHDVRPLIMRAWSAPLVLDTAYRVGIGPL